MDILQLRYFQKVAQLEHVTRAAEELMIAQPAVSKTVHQLEKEFDCKLFVRSGRNIQLNQQGKKLLSHANQVLSDIDLLYADMRGEQEKLNNSLTLSVQVASELLPELIMRFKRLHPQANISIVQYVPDDEENNYSDISIYATLEPVNKGWMQTVLEEPIYLATPLDHPLTGQRIIALSDVKDEAFISLSKGGNLTEIINHYCAIAGFSPNVVLSCDNPSTLRSFIKLGLGIAFVPAITWQSLAQASIALHPLVQPECKRYVNIRWKKRGYINPMAIAFRKLAFDFFHSFYI